MSVRKSLTNAMVACIPRPSQNFINSAIRITSGVRYCKEVWIVYIHKLKTPQRCEELVSICFRLCFNVKCRKDREYL